MDIDQLRSLAKKAKTVQPSNSSDVGKLVKLSQIYEKRIQSLREEDPLSDQKSDDELAKIVGNTLERDVGFSLDEGLESYGRIFKKLASSSLVGVLPMLLALRGRPYTLEDHFPMEPMFRRELPIRFLLRCGRQVAKSTTFAAQGVIQSGATPYFNSLFVTPLFEQCRRFSTNYVRPFVVESPLYRTIVDNRCEQSVLQRSFKNKSTMFFSYCLKDADRIRGISADRVTVDEVQDIDWDLLPVVLETMSASKWAVMQAAGTPKTLDNTIEYLWNSSSQAEWVTRCGACNHWNIACMEQDLLKMIGKETVVCSKCQRPINPRPAFHPKPKKRGTGYWLHTFPDRVAEFPGYHAPQVIFPMHFDNPRKWKILRKKMDPSDTPRHLFINEVLGEGADVGTKLVTQAELIRAAKVYNRHNTVFEALKQKGSYLDVSIGVDWGGSTAPYGSGRAHLLLKPEETQSYTVLAVVGLKPNGKIDVLYIYKFELIGNHLEEAQACMTMWRDIDESRGSTLFCHDFGGAGSVRETLMVQMGLPVQNIVGCAYMPAPQARMMELKEKGSRVYYATDKARSLIFLCQAIKVGFVGLPTWSSCHHLAEDFLALMEDTVERPGGFNIMRVIRKPGVSDDTAHAINFAALGLWHRHGYPNFKDVLSMEAIIAKLDKSAKVLQDDDNLGKLMGHVQEDLFDEDS